MPVSILGVSALEKILDREGGREGEGEGEEEEEEGERERGRGRERKAL